MSWQNKVNLGLQQRHTAEAYRHRSINEVGSGRFITVDGKRYLNFSGNDYLGLSQHPAVIRAWQQGAEKYGVGSGGSGHVTGHTRAHQVLEESLAHWLGYSRALLFISGYAANQAVLAALLDKSDHILADRLSHASLLEAASLSPAQLRRFAHNDVGMLANLLEKTQAGQTLVISEGVFSMDGDMAPLLQLHTLTQQHGAWLLVDDAHGIGVIGEQGRGSCWQQSVQPEILIITFGKSFGVSGAAVLCSDDVAEYLIQFARHLIYSTAMPPAQACAISASLREIQEGDELRQRLQQNMLCFQSSISKQWLGVMPSKTPIQPLIVGENQRALNLSASLRRAGIWGTAIRPPTVPEGSARLRMTITASHQSEDIERLSEVLNDACH